MSDTRTDGGAAALVQRWREQAAMLRRLSEKRRKRGDLTIFGGPSAEENDAAADLQSDQAITLEDCADQLAALAAPVMGATEMSDEVMNAQLAYEREQVKTLIAALAECYRLTGADPDGNEDWRLAPFAVDEVRSLRAFAANEVALRQQAESQLRALAAPVERTPTEQPEDGTGQGRLMLNAYGRQCYDAGRASVGAVERTPAAPWVTHACHCGLVHLPPAPMPPASSSREGVCESSEGSPLGAKCDHLPPVAPDPAPALAPLLTAALADRDSRPWRYYKVDYETLKKFAEQKADQLDAQRAQVATLTQERDAEGQRNEMLQDKVATLTARLDTLQRQPSDDYALACWQAQAHEAQTQLQETQRAARALLDKLKAMESPINGCLDIARVHGFAYAGPNWGEEVMALAARLPKEGAG